MKYEPTEAQIENLRPKEGHLLLSGDGVFHTIQGEGDLVGMPTTFIRLQNCNLSCSWCDSKYTWNKDMPEYYEEPIQVPIEEIIPMVMERQREKGVEEFIPEVAITGGEPLIQQKEILNLVELYPDIRFQIETNGTVKPSEEILELAYAGRIKFNCSPKLPNNGMDIKRLVKPEALALINSVPTTVFKFVSISPQDIEDIETYYGKYVDKKKIMIMPEGLTEEANNEHLKAIVGIIIQKGYRITPRLQNSLFQNRRRF